MPQQPDPVAVVAGAGPGNGSSLARRFARAGYTIAVLSRHETTLAPLKTELPEVHTFECDVGEKASVAEAFSRIQREVGDARPFGETW
jgi:NADP-dependent 3-hydroxy acid dehydrogenase YdfG